MMTVNLFPVILTFVLVGWTTTLAAEEVPPEVPPEVPSSTTESTANQPRVWTPRSTYYGASHISSRRKEKYYSFTGIPYARAPIGHLRFQPPQPSDHVDAHFSATVQPHECLQWDTLLSRGIVGHEDCLYLNVFTNRIPEAPLYLNTQPVVVLLHAGTWGSGGGAMDIFTPEYLLEMSVMVITVNSRVGPLGYLTTESKDAPGNLGLLDQIMALEWIRENSRYFGGMNDTVTIMGNGAGGTAVHLLTLSPKARGVTTAVDENALFHRAISQSGTAYSPHGIIRDPLEKAQQLAKKLRCKTKDANTMISCLQLVPGNKIIEAIPTLYEFDEEPLLFGPVIDGPWMGKEAVVPDEPHRMIKHYQMLHVPWMVGTNKNDGAFRVQDILKDHSLVRQLNKNWDTYGPLLLHLTKHSCKDPVEMAHKIKDFYMGKSKFGEDSVLKFIEMMTDRFFFYPTEKASQEHSLYLKRHKQYCYRYHLVYCGKTSFLDILHKVNPKESADAAFGKSEHNPRFKNKLNDAHGLGVSFMDELLYLFPSSKLDFLYKVDHVNNDAAEISRMMLMVWSNFMKSADPTPTINGMPTDFSPWNIWWEPYLKGTHYYLQIDPEMETQEEPLKPKEMEFWRNLPLWENVDHNVIRDEL